MLQLTAQANLIMNKDNKHTKNEWQKTRSQETGKCQRFGKKRKRHWWWRH